MSGDVAAGRYLDPRDRAYADTLEDDARETVVNTVAHFRRPDRLSVSDQLPQLELLRLEDGATVALRSFAGDRPLVLVFGSFT
jgi:hypothetical protein